MRRGKVSKRLIDKRAVYDSLDNLTLHIIGVDIAKADRREPLDCVVARCARREHHVEEVRVHLARVFVRRRNQPYWLKYETPLRLKNEIMVFDRGGKFMPGEFTLKAIGRTHRVGYRPPGNKRGSGKGKRGYHVAEGVRSSAKEGTTLS